ncbi:MAG: hypothetical protein OXF43_00615, partial [Gammaproteobacteria bacterium]|nr:hypothetical protein [Gammaproteobacteria bacterium]
FSGRCEYIPVRFGLDILSRTPAERHPARRRLTLCQSFVIPRAANLQAGFVRVGSPGRGGGLR